MPLIIILAECGLELIPKQIRSHPAVRQNVSQSNYSSQLLDNALHFSAMKNLKNIEKRGRPDITHACLLNALGSSLNKSGNLILFIHTIHDLIFKINPEIRIARNYNRFKGLMAKLMIDRSINVKVNNMPLISQVDGNFEDLISEYKNPEIILLSNRGKLIKNYEQLFPKDLMRNIIVIIGGFQKSTFSKKINAISNKFISLSKYPLDAWVVISKIINFYELSHNLI